MGSAEGRKKFKLASIDKTGWATGGLTNPRPGAEDAEPVILVPVGLPCLERGRLYKKRLGGPLVKSLNLGVSSASLVF